MLCAATWALAQPGYYRFAAPVPEGVVFTAEGDLWRAPANGGAATRLTTHPRGETRAAVSPDGKTLAFSAALEGPTEVYVMPLAGGDTQRLTFEGETAHVLGWTPKGEVLYSTVRHSGLPARQLATIHPKTLAKRVLPVHKSAEGTITEDNTLVFTRNGLRGDNARRYRGGSMAQIWAMNLNTEAEATQLTREAQGNNSQPMWWQGKVYFVSDRSGARNLWRMERDGSGAKQLTFLKPADLDLRQTQLYAGRIAYTVGSDVRVFDIAANADRALKISLTSDFEQRRERWLATPLRNATSASLSPNGDWVAVTARGHVVVAGTGDLRRTQVATPAGSRSRAATFSADGRHLLMFNDASGEMELTQLSATNAPTTATRQLTSGGDMLRLTLAPSPDGKYVAHTDHSNRLWITEVATQKTELIERAAREPGNLKWAPDSSALAYTRPMRSRRGTDVLYLWPLATRKPVALTSERYTAKEIAFTPDNKWLFFVSDRNLQPNPAFPWGDRNMGSSFDKRDKIYAVSLQSANRWPFAPRTELNMSATPEATASAPAATPAATAAAAASAPASSASAPGAAASAPARSTPRLATIDYAGLEQRLYEVPAALVPPANLMKLATDGRRLFYVERETGVFGRGALKSVALDVNSPPPVTHSSDVIDVQIATTAVGGQRKMLIVRRPEAAPQPEFAIMDAAASPPTVPADVARTAVRLTDWQVLLNPRDEWKAMFADAWRMHRDYFWDPAMSGVDWKAMRAKYEPQVAKLTDRDELADLLGQMIGELNTLHSQIGAGDVRTTPEQVNVGGLGAEFEATADGLRITKIYRTDPELPSERSPLAQPGVGARVGDVLSAINHQPMKTEADLDAALRGQVGKQVLLSLKRGTDSVQTIAVPVTLQRERSLRTSDWEQDRFDRVEKAGDGKLGYFRLRSMLAADVATFAREFYPLVEREGLIIDVRGNAGGAIDSLIIEKLLRKAWSVFSSREGDNGHNMQNAFRGHVALLVDEDTYSNGETIAEAVKRLGIATVIGKRTQGAGIWLTDRNTLADGGIARVAEFGVWGASDGAWMIEGKGVVPDIEVDNLPRATSKGQDAQLEAAIDHLKKTIAAKPVKPFVMPAYPVR